MFFVNPFDVCQAAWLKALKTENFALFLCNTVTVIGYPQLDSCIESKLH